MRKLETQLPPMGLDAYGFEVGGSLRAGLESLAESGWSRNFGAAVGHRKNTQQASRRSAGGQVY
jgi:hypothetical protein